MGYVGNQTSNSYTSLDKQTITGDGGASYTLDHAVANEQEIEVFVNNVRQEPSVAYTVSGTALTMTGNVESSDDFYVVFQGKAIQTTSHPEGQDLKARDGTFSGDVDIQGNELILDADGDSKIEAGTDDTVTVSTGGSERLRINSSGNLGVGKTSPAYRGHFADASGATRVQIENTNNAAGGAGVYLTTYSSGSLVGNATLACDNSGNLKIFTGTSSGSERMRVDSSGNVLLKTQTIGGEGWTFAGGGFLYHAAASGAARSMTGFYNGGNVVGEIRTSTTSTSYLTSSDHRLKENAVDMTGAITRVKSLQPKRFNFIIDDSTTVDGFMAHEAATVVPEAVSGTHNEVDADGNPVYQGVDQAKLVPLLTGALQEAIAKIEALETRVQALEDA